MKINLSKIWNVFFHALIVCTLLLCLFMMTKYFFFKDSKSLELGSLSDWFSTLANIATACAAVYAAFKAINLLSPKLHNDAYELSKQAIVIKTNDLIIATGTIVNICTKTKSTFINSDKKPALLALEELEFLRPQIALVKKIKSDIESDFRILKKLGFHLNPEANALFIEHSKNILTLLSSAEAFYLNVNDLITDINNPMFFDRFNNRYGLVLNIHMSVGLSHSKFYYFREGFFEYFNYKKN